MTILEKIQLGKNAYANIHEAPYNLTTSEQRQQWIREEKSCFDKKILEFWKLYCTPFSKKDKCILPIEAEQDERRRFIKYPIMTLEIDSLTKNYIVGGLWIDDIKINPNKKEKTASIHLKLLRENRNLAYPFFEKFIKSVNHKYDYIYAGWGQREIEDDPTNFLQNWKFEVNKTAWGNRALLKLDDLRDTKS